MKTKLKTIGLIMLAFCLVLSLVSCGNGKTTAETSKETSDDTQKTDQKDADESKEDDLAAEDGYIHLKYLALGSGILEEEESLTVKKVAEDTGIMVHYETIPEEKYNVLMASGGLSADIISPQSIHMKQLIEGELIMPLDDLVTSLGQDIQANAGKSIAFWKKNKSEGQDKLYFIPSHNITNQKDITDSYPFNYAVAPFIRWDYYQEIGAPEVNNEDDLLDVLRQIQDLHPETEDGKKTYAISLHSDSLLWTYTSMYQFGQGVDSLNLVVMKDNKGVIVEDIFSPDYTFWNGLEFFNKAHRMGLYDPESFTQKGENQAEKCTTGQSFFTDTSWNSYNDVLAETVGKQAGFQPILGAFPYQYAAYVSTYGWSFTLSIPSDCTNPEAAMKWINYLYTEDAARTLYSGIQGTHWDYDENKVPKLTEETLKMHTNEDWNKLNGINKYHNQIGLDNAVLHSDGYPLDLFISKDVLASRNTANDQEYCDFYGVSYPGEVGKKLQEEGKTIVNYIGDSGGAAMPSLPDNLGRIKSKMEDHLIKSLPKLIMSDTKEEFDKNKAEAIETLRSFGVQEIIDWTTEEYNKAVDAAKMN